MSYSYSAYSNRGGRENNEDAVKISIREECAAFVVADGLGGHGYGEVASELAAGSVCSFFESTQFGGEAAKSSVLYANAALIEMQKKETKYKSMRSTVACAFLLGSEVYCANVGDTRIYHFRNGCASLISQDHSVAAVMQRAQAEIKDTRFDPDRNRLTRVLGNREDVEPYSARLFCGIGDALLICTDGFWEYIFETEMEIDLAKSRTPNEWITYMLVRIYDRAPEKHDNLSAICVML